MPKQPAPRVLIVDASEDSRLILGELLAHSGIDAVTTGVVAKACDRLANETVTALVVIDTDALTAQELRLLGNQAARTGAPIVAVGTNRPESSEGRLVFVRKPYHYRELVHKIVLSLGVVGTQARAAA